MGALELVQCMGSQKSSASGVVRSRRKFENLATARVRRRIEWKARPAEVSQGRTASSRDAEEEFTGNRFGRSTSDPQVSRLEGGGLVRRRSEEASGRCQAKEDGAANFVRQTLLDTEFTRVEPGGVPNAARG